MDQFKFDAPNYYNFFRAKKVNRRIQLDLSNPNDLWFMIQHEELTPAKNSNSKLDLQDDQEEQKQEKMIHFEPKQSGNIPHNKQRFKKFNAGLTKQPLKRQQRNWRELKKKSLHASQSHVSLHSKKSNSSNSSASLMGLKEHKKVISQALPNKIPQKAVKISRAKSETLVNLRSKVRNPCPFPLRVQRNWELKSHKEWYSLTEQSAQKALRSMKKMTQKSRKKTPNKSKPRFRY